MEMHQTEIITVNKAVGGVAGSLCQKYELVLQKFAVMRYVFFIAYDIPLFLGLKPIEC